MNDLLIKRVTLSLVGGMSIPVLLFFAAVFASGSTFEWLAGILFFAVGWPLEIYSPIFPPPADAPFFEPTTPAMLATMLCDLIVYSLLSYAFLYWRNIAGKDETVFQTLNLSSPRDSYTVNSNVNRARLIGAPSRVKTTASFNDEAWTDAQTFARHSRVVR